jgi:RNA polymerase sigma-70 factor (ECF subfamily)
LVSSDADDSALVRRCAEGDQQAFAQLLDRYETPVFNVVLRMVHDYEDARDTTQTVFVKAFTNLGSFDPRRRFFSWIYRIAINESLNFIGKRSRREIATAAATSGMADSGATDHRAAEAGRDLHDALARIQPDDRAAILLKHILGCSYRDMARILDLPEKTVKSRLYTARERLRKALLGKKAAHGR